jgi:hypothetical protein
VTSRVAELERRHGFAKPRPERLGVARRALAAVADRITANVRAFFVCTRGDLLSGDPAQILGIPRLQAAFVDRVPIASMIMSGITVWGEELLDLVPLPPIRRLDVLKALQGLLGQLVFAAVWFPLLPDATKYAMGALKGSLHNCHVVHCGRTAPLAAEVAYFQARYGPLPALDELLALRRAYRPSFRFVLAALGTVARLHLHTLRDVPLPRVVRTA